MVATVRTLPRVNAEEKSFIRFVVEESPNVLENPSKGYRQRGPLLKLVAEKRPQSIRAMVSTTISQIRTI